MRKRSVFVNVSCKKRRAFVSDTCPLADSTQATAARDQLLARRAVLRVGLRSA